MPGGIWQPVRLPLEEQMRKTGAPLSRSSEFARHLVPGQPR
jgi:hypothetical protein